MKHRPFTLLIIFVTAWLTTAQPALAAATVGSTTRDFFGSIPWVAVASWAIANAFPYLAAVATKAPSWATGAITAILAVADSFLTELVAKGAGFDWKFAIVNSFATWLIAFFHHAAFLRGTRLVGRLHEQYGNKPVTANA